MTQKQSDLSVARRIQHFRYAFLIRSQIVDTQLLKPGMQRVITSTRTPMRRWEIGVPPCLLLHSARGNSELFQRRLLDKVKVGFVVRRVVHRLSAKNTAISDQVRQQPKPVLTPAESSSDGLRDTPGYGDPAAHRQSLQRQPSRESAEGMIG